MADVKFSEFSTATLTEVVGLDAGGQNARQAFAPFDPANPGAIGTGTPGGAFFTAVSATGLQLSGGATITKVSAGSAGTSGAAVLAASYQTVAITVTGAAQGDIGSVSWTTSPLQAGIVYCGCQVDTDVVVAQFYNTDLLSSQNLASVTLFASATRYA